MGAAAFAYASTIYSTRPEAALRAFGKELAVRATKAWDWATAHPNALYYNNDDSKQPGSKGLAAGQQEMDDAQRRLAKFEAAVYLYELTGDGSYKNFVEGNYLSIIPNHGPTQWDADRQEVLVYCTRLPRISTQVQSAILKHFISAATTNADQLSMVTHKKDPYCAPIKDYTWGSNQSKMLQARLYQLLATCSDDAAFAASANSAALGYIHDIHGVNPLGLVYLTNMQSAGAEHSVSTMFHHWFAHSSARWGKVTVATPGPPPGYLVGGPNPHYSKDACCTERLLCRLANPSCRKDLAPPLGQPAMKSYRQFNEGWPVNSWEITEPSTGYQASYIRVLAPYVR